MENIIAYVCLFVIKIVVSNEISLNNVLKKSFFVIITESGQQARDLSYLII